MLSISTNRYYHPNCRARRNVLHIKTPLSQQQSENYFLGPAKATFFYRFSQARSVLVVCDDVLPTRSHLPRNPSMYGATLVVATVMDHV